MTQPSYYAIIPADVRYDNRLTPNEKLMYGELTCLSTKYGYCFASNSYFAELYDKDERTVRRWLENLEECGYIRRELTQKDNQTVERKIYLINKVYENDREDKNVLPPPDKNVLYNNTRYLIIQDMGECPQAPQNKTAANEFTF